MSNKLVGKQILKESLLFPFLSVIFLMSCSEIGREKQLYPNKLIILADHNRENIIGSANGNFNVVSNRESPDFGFLQFNNTDKHTSYITFKLNEIRDLRNVQNIGMWIYVEDASKVSSITLEVISKDNRKRWSRSTLSPHMSDSLVDNWNLIRWQAIDGGMIDIENYHPGKVKISFNTNSITTFKLGYIFAEIAEKAKILFIQDGGYSGGWIDTDLAKGQKKSGIDECKQRNMPITWALNPLKIDEQEEQTMTLSILNTLKQDSIHYWSFHSYSRAVLKNYSNQEIKKDVDQCLNWLENNGFKRPRFRAAHTQNIAPKAFAAINYRGLKAMATYKAETGGLETFPFTQRWNLRRWAIHGQTKKEMRDMFNLLKTTRGLMIPYTHKIISDSNRSKHDITIEMWNYFLSCIDEGIEEGWIELVDYNSLQNKLCDYNIKDNDEYIKNTIVNELERKANQRK